MTTRAFVRTFITLGGLCLLAMTGTAENFNPDKIGLRVLKKTWKKGSIYTYVLGIRVYTNHDKVESKLGGVGQVPVKIDATNYRVTYESGSGKTWVVKVKANGQRIAEDSMVVDGETNNWK